MAVEVDEAVYGLLAQTSAGRYSLPKNAIAHFIIASDEPMREDNLGGYIRNRTLLCGLNVREGQRPRPIHVWDRSAWHKDARVTTACVCARCWGAYHRLKGVPAPKQVKPVERGNYEELPLREVVNRLTGERWLPYRIVRYNGQTLVLSENAIKKDGGIRHYGWDDHSGSLGGNHRFAYYDPDREAAAQEIRQEIAMHERRLAEAKQHLRDLYAEPIDGP